MGRGLLDEFKQFAMRGNVIDLAIAVVIGAAFGWIVTSLVNDLIMPPLGMLTGGVDFSGYFIDLSGGGYATLAEAQAADAATVNYGLFINTIVEFVIVAFAIFIVVKQINRLKRREEEPAAPPTPPRQEVLLSEIRDLLKSK